HPPDPPTQPRLQRSWHTHPNPLPRHQPDPALRGQNPSLTPHGLSHHVGSPDVWRRIIRTDSCAPMRSPQIRATRSTLGVGSPGTFAAPEVQAASLSAGSPSMTVKGTGIVPAQVWCP